ncbi:MAG: peptidoglycan-binding protein [Acidimicrobiia bacterium]
MPQRDGARRVDELETHDLQLRLIALGHSIAAEELGGAYGSTTTDAVREFQRARGLRVDGVAGRETWSALIECGYTLGDRLLYERAPAMRGDDVAELQSRLNSLGFDAGRVDGIAGIKTINALREFQRNAGLAVDGIAGPTTLVELRRLGVKSKGEIASVREREWLRSAARDLAGHPVLLAVAPEFHALGETIRSGLANLGSPVVAEMGGLDDHELANTANGCGASWVIALRPGSESGCHVHYYGTARFVSQAGCHLAETIATALEKTALPGPHVASARTYGLMRETVMPTVAIEPVAKDDSEGTRALVNDTPAIADAVVAAFLAVVSQPLD